MIKNIIFDLGGVIYDIRYENIPEAFARMGAGNLMEIYSKAKQTDFIDRYEEGLMSSDEFCEEIRRQSISSLSRIVWRSVHVKHYMPKR